MHFFPQGEPAKKPLRTMASCDEEKEDEQQFDEKKEEESEEEEAEEEEDTEAEILLGPLDMTVLKGQSATFTATFTGKPQPVVSWLKKVSYMFSIHFKYTFSLTHI